MALEAASEKLVRDLIPGKITTAGAERAAAHMARVLRIGKIGACRALVFEALTGHAPKGDLGFGSVKAKLSANELAMGLAWHLAAGAR